MLIASPLTSLACTVSPSKNSGRQEEAASEEDEQRVAVDAVRSALGKNSSGRGRAIRSIPPLASDELPPPPVRSSRTDPVCLLPDQVRILSLPLHRSPSPVPFPIRLSHVNSMLLTRIFQLGIDSEPAPDDRDPCEFSSVFNVVLPQIDCRRELHFKVTDLECKSHLPQAISSSNLTALVSSASSAIVPRVVTKSVNPSSVRFLPFTPDPSALSPQSCQEDTWNTFRTPSASTSSFALAAAATRKRERET
ncbi:hypothetical protein BD311DRAFT_807053 [Dichomitus squalens]|uniref:Uncharacterized protein n=1 Tax=Dichomitus squalens TaxID=114155 RepID=A0A4V2K0B0_9APHY|nr:hypothetical protein BD311DRAFT_807053 [Dichomitus squalens]